MANWLDSEHTFVITAGGNAVTAYLIEESFKLTNALGQQIDTCNFTLEDAYKTMPDIDIWDAVTVVIDGVTTIFSGYITNVVSEPADSEATKRVKVSCQDKTALLGKEIVINETYEGQTDEAVLDSLFSTYLPEITTVNVAAAPGVWSFHFDNKTLLDVVKEIAEKTRSQWFIDAAGDLHWWQGTTPSTAPFSLSDAPDGVNTFPWQKGSLRIDDDGTELVNCVTVYGGKTQTAIITETFSGDGSTAEFSVSQYPVDSVISITVDGVYQQWATDFIVDDFSPSVDVLVAYFRGRFRWDGAYPPPPGLNNIVIKYTCQSQVSVSLCSAASIAQYGRTIRRVVNSRDLVTVGEATEYAEAYLAEYALRRRTGYVTVERWGLSAGDALGITCAALGLDASRGWGAGGYGEDGYSGDTYVVQSVTTGFGAKGVEHRVEFAEYRPSLAKYLEGLAKGTTSTGSLPERTTTTDFQTGEGGVMYGGTYQFFIPPGDFSWNPSYGSATGAAVGLDWSRTPPAGKMIVLSGGHLIGVFGDLNGEFDYVSSIGALGLGEYGVTASMSVDATNGIRFFDTTPAVIGQLSGTTWILGDTANEHVQITSTALQFKDGATVYGNLEGGELTLGSVAGGEYAIVSSDGIKLYGGGLLRTQLLNTGVLALGDVSNENLIIGSTYLRFRNGSTIVAELVNDILTLGISTAEHVKIDTSGMRFYDGDTLLSTYHSSGITIGDTDNEHLQITSTALNFKDGATVYGSMSGATWTLGPTSARYVKITSTQIEMYNAATQVMAVGGSLENIVVGPGAGQAFTTGHDNTLLGKQAGASLTTGYYNTLIGREAGRLLTTGFSNVAIGDFALYGAAASGANGNVVIGSVIAGSATTAANNVLIGNQCARDITSGEDNIAIGALSLLEITASSNNIAIGRSAMEAATSADACVCIGTRASFYNVTGERNTCVGYEAGQGASGQSYSDNVLLGYMAGHDVTTGGHNTLVGKGAGSGLTTGQYNILIGSQCAENLTTGSNNIIIGYDVDAPAVGSTNQVILGVINLSIGEIFIPASAIWPSTTNGCANLVKREYTTNDADLMVLGFDKDSDEFAQFTLAMPRDWNAGTFTAVFHWTTAGGSSSQTVTWAIQGRCHPDSAPLDQSWGTAQVIQDTWLAADDYHISGSTPAITVAGTTGAGRGVQMRIYRDVSADNLASDADLIGIMLTYTRGPSA
jgi:hypothetical protein